MIGKMLRNSVSVPALAVVTLVSGVMLSGSLQAQVTIIRNPPVNAAPVPEAAPQPAPEPAAPVAPKHL